MTRKIYFEDVILFFIVWISMSLLWVVWLDGIYTPIAGFLSALIFIIVTSLLNSFDKK